MLSNDGHSSLPRAMLRTLLSTDGRQRVARKRTICRNLRTTSSMHRDPTNCRRFYFSIFTFFLFFTFSYSYYFFCSSQFRFLSFFFGRFATAHPQSNGKNAVVCIRLQMSRAWPAIHNRNRYINAE